MVLQKESRKRGREPLIICIGGMAGSGKSTLAKKIAEKYNLRYFSGGDALMTLAIEEGYKPLQSGWWESRKGIQFLEERSRDPRFDQTVDKRLLGEAEKGNVVLDSWTMPWLLKKGYKIWLEASVEKRAERIAQRDGIGFKKAIEALRRKERHTRDIYKKIYGFNLGEDFDPFDFILDIGTLDAEEVFHTVCLVIDNVVFPKE